MGQVAAMWHEGDEVAVFCAPAEEPHDVLVAIGGRIDHERGAVVVPAGLVEEVSAELDRMGYRWALDRSDAPRTWAERLFAETPERLHETLYLSLFALLAGRDGDATHLAVLRAARRVEPGG
jgi:hypothetical protein